MEDLPCDFYKEALNLIHHSTKNQSQLSSSVKSLLKNQFFKEEKVQFSSNGQKHSGKIIGVFRETSPSNKENPLKYNVETAETVFEAIPINKLIRETKIEDNEPFTFITSVAKKPASEGPWIIRDEYAEKYEIKDKLHPIFSNMSTSNGNGKLASSAPASTNSAVKKENGTPFAGPSKRNFIASDDSSDDDDAPIVGVRKSGVGMAPSSAAAKKMTKKPTQKKPKSPTKKEDKAKKSPIKKQPKSSTKKADKSPSKAKNGKTESKTSKKKQTNLSDFLTQGGGSSQNASASKSPPISHEERMEKRAVNLNKQLIKSIVTMDVTEFSKLLEGAAKNFPSAFVSKMPNEFVRYCYNKALLKHEQKGKTAEEKLKLRSENKDLQAINEFSYLHRKILAGKFEDSWIANSFDLPDFPTVDQDIKLLFTCIRLSAFLQSYRQVLDVRKNPTLFELISSLDNEEDGFWKVTGSILTTVTDFIRKNQRTIPHFNSGYLNYNVRHITLKTVHQVARKILNPDYNPNAMPEESEDESDAASATSSRSGSPMEVDGEEKKQNGAKHESDEEEQESDDEEEEDGEARIALQSKEDDDLCERFCHSQLYEMKPLEQARILELLIERVEASGPVRNSMKNTDAEVKKLKDNIAGKEKKMEKLNKTLEELPPMIGEEDYSQYSRAVTIGIVKKNRERKELEEKKEELELEITEIRDAIEEMRGMSRFRAAPLGYDRFWRRYWFFPPTPGILIEQGAWTVETPDESQPLAMPVKQKFGNDVVTDEQLVKFLHTLCNGGYPSTCAPVKWTHVNSQESLDRLFNCLNPKGVRESNLRDAIQKSRNVIEASFKHRN